MSPTHAPRIFGERYRTIRVLGGGSHAVVYEAENTWTGRRVAVKCLHPAHAADSDVTRRFFDEARMISRLRHPNVVDVLDMGEDPDTGDLFIVQELLDGEDLAAALRRRGRFSPREAVDVMVPVMRALAAIHAKRVVHRDVKPSNIVLARGVDGAIVPRLIDFGVAKFADDARPASARTATGRLLGTPAYMAPEQHVGASDVDARADVWSVGVVLYELLSGENPFAAGAPGAITQRVLHEPPPRLDRAPAALADMVQRAMTVDRARRTPTMEALLDEAVVWTRTATSRRALARIAAATLGVGALAAVLGWRAGVAADAGDRFTVTLHAMPSSAELEVDGRVVGAGAWSGSFTRDGAAHVARVRAPGHVEHVLRFRDAAPPAQVRLRAGSAPVGP